MFGYKIIRKKDLEGIQRIVAVADEKNKKLEALLEQTESIRMVNEGLRATNDTLKDAYSALLEENKKLRRENAMLWHDNREQAASRCAKCELREGTDGDD